MIITWYFPLLFLMGAFVGMYSSVAGGGAIILIPVFTVMGVPLTSAIATMRLSSVFQQGIAVLAFIKEGRISWRPALWSGIWCVPGAYIGAQLVIGIDQNLLAKIVALLMSLLLVAAFLFDRNQLKKHRRTKRKNSWQMLAVLSFVLGIYGGFYGAGFSTMLMFVFVFFSGLTLIESSADSSVATLFMSVTASLLFLDKGLIDWNIWLPVTLGGVLGSWYGVESAVKFGTGWIKGLLVLVIFLSVAKLAF